MSPAWGKCLANRRRLSDTGFGRVLSGSLLGGSCFAPSFYVFIFGNVVCSCRDCLGREASQCHSAGQTALAHKSGNLDTTPGFSSASK